MKRQEKIAKWNLNQPKNGIQLTKDFKEAMNNQELEILQAKYIYKKRDDRYELAIDAHILNHDVDDKIVRLVVINPVISRIKNLDEIVGARIKSIGDTIVTSALRNASRIVTDVVRTHKVEGLTKFTISSYHDEDYDESLAKSENCQVVAKDEYVSYTEKMNLALYDGFVEKVKFK